jgi:uncharacterized protein involved in exopolysaccharide biosynthesis
MKWWLIGTIIIVLIVGFLFIFLQPPLYSSVSRIQIKQELFIEEIYEFYPSEAALLDFGKFDKAYRNMESIENLDQVRKNLDVNISNFDLERAIKLSWKWGTRKITIETTHKDAVLAFNINQAMLDFFVYEKNEKYSKAFDSLMSKIDVDLNNLEEELGTIPGNILETEDAEPDDLIYYQLSRLQYNLSKNSGSYKEKIRILKEPEIAENPVDRNIGWDIVFTAAMAVFLGLTLTYSVDYFRNSKKRNN